MTGSLQGGKELDATLTSTLADQGHSASMRAQLLPLPEKTIGRRSRTRLILASAVMES